MKFMLISCVALMVASSCFAGAEKISVIDDIDPKQEAELRKLTPEFVKLTKILTRKLGRERNHEKNIKIAKELSTKAESGCIGSCLAGGSWRKALEIYVALESTLGRCDTESYEILMKNYIAIELAKEDANVYRARDALDFYHGRYSRACGPVLKDKFFENLKNVPAVAVERIERTFRYIDVIDFIPPSSLGIKYDLFGKEKPKFSKFSAAQITVARQVMAQAKRDKVEEPFVVESLFNEYMFEPCRHYRHQLGSILTEARFANAYYIERNEFSRGDDKFHQALIDNRLCASLLEEQEQLYKPLSEAFEVVLRMKVY